jgi:hypothetical protein
VTITDYHRLLQTQPAEQALPNRKFNCFSSTIEQKSALAENTAKNMLETGN